MADKLYFSKEEVFEALSRADEARKKHGKEPMVRRSFSHFGFNCISSFCETEFGWVQSWEECCESCVAYLIGNYGGESDKRKFNENQTLGSSARIPITNKERAIRNKAKYKRTSKVRSKMKRKGSRRRLTRKSNKEHQEMLSRFRKAGISVLRRNKLTIKNDLVMVTMKKELHKKFGCSGLGSYVYVKGVKPQRGYLYISKEEYLYEHVKKVARQHNVSSPESFIFV